MTTAQASRSAGLVALGRAIESARPDGERLFTDPHASSFVGTGARALVALSRLPWIGSLLLGLPERVAFGQRAFIVARTRWIDDALEAALGRGVEQVLILGAGYDSRAFRIRGIERARVFEVDHPDTQATKRERLQHAMPGVSARVSFIPIDLRRQCLRDPLIDAGFLEGRPCFVICEGVTEYLDKQAVDAILRFVARSTAPGSEIAFTYLDHALLAGARDFRGARCQRAMNRRSRERFEFGIDPQTLEAELAKRGFRLLDDAAGAELDRRYFRPHGRRERSNEYQHVALASVRAQDARG